LKSSRVILASGIDLRHTIDDFAQRDSSAIIPNLYLVLGNLYLYAPAIAHHVLIDGVVQDLLDEHVDPVILSASVSQFTDVHPGTKADMLPPIERFDTVFGVFNWFCHNTRLCSFHLFEFPHQNDK